MGRSSREWISLETHTCRHFHHLCGCTGGFAGDSERGSGLYITADAFLFLEPGVKLPAMEIEFVGTACGTHQYVNDRFQFVPALPVICIEDDGIERVCPVLLSLVAVG